MKQIHFKILLILLGMVTIFGLSGCKEEEGKDGAHSPVNLLDGTPDDEPVNNAPHADAGEDLKVNIDMYYDVDYYTTKVISAVEGNVSNGVHKVDLNGSNSTDDGLKDPLTYSWSLVHSDTSSQPTLNNNNTAEPYFSLSCDNFTDADSSNCTYSDDGRHECTYIIKLTVDDGELSDEDNVTVTASYSDDCRYSGEEY